MASPLAQGLFQQSIIHSGGDHVATLAESASLADALLRVLGLDDPTEERLLSVPADDVLAAQQALGTGVQATWLWRPTVDGRVLPMTPTAAFERGQARGIRMIAGVTSNEACGYDLAEPSATDHVPTVLGRIFGPRASEVLDVYRTGRPGATEREVRRAVLTDERYAVPTIRLLERQCGYAATWRFLFNAPTPGTTPDRWGFHGADMAYLWDVGMTNAGPELRSLASSLRQAWANFVAFRSPEADGLPRWPSFSLPERSTLVIETQPRIEPDPRAHERALWQRSTWNPGPWWPLPLTPSSPKKVSVS
jgi:para-nitrobenzyl esterase